MTHKEIAVEFRGEAEQVAVIRLMRAAKRNALSDGLVLGLRDVFMNLPASVRAAVEGLADLLQEIADASGQVSDRLALRHFAHVDDVSQRTVSV